jgi:hypothetical protein
VIGGNCRYFTQFQLCLFSYLLTIPHIPLHRNVLIDV